MTKIKQLAEQHLYMGKRLTLSEYRQLLHSKYSRLINSSNVESKFDTFVENVIPQETTEFTFNRSNLYPHIESRVVRELLDELEEQFHLDISSSAHNRYGKVNIDQMKSYIHMFLTQHLMKSETKNFIKDIAEGNSIHNILYRLYLACS